MGAGAQGFFYFLAHPSKHVKIKEKLPGLRFGFLCICQKRFNDFKDQPMMFTKKLKVGVHFA